MKFVLLICATFIFTGSACAQSWRDSLSLGKKMYEEGKYDKAYKTLVEAQKIAPEGVDLSKDIGNAAYRKGDYAMAEKAFRSVASNSGSKQQSSKHWHNVGNSQLKRKDYQSAIESYKQALRENPDNENARYNLAEAKRRLKKQQEQQKQEEQNKDKDQNDDQQKNQDQDKQQGQDGQNQENDQQQGDQQDSQNQSQQSGDSKNGSSQSKAEKLSSKKTERMLDELLKKEMSTKRKAVGTKSSSSGEVESGKKW